MKNYWNKYYKLKLTPLAASSFAKYCWNNYLKKNRSILEIGCGNGRDSFFFNIDVERSCDRGVLSVLLR